ncbi:hypothetical protein, partial [Elioraea sp.]|uniref:hypothetical protein n=1 Tax=Elioraea sp. TaxID=2185103 RepID=UPI003F709BD5
MSRSSLAAALIAVAVALPAAAESPSDLRGIFSPDLSCAATSLRHVVGADTLEWREGGRRLLMAEVDFVIQADRIGMVVRKVENGDAPLRPGDVVQYRRVPGGIRPLVIERHGTSMEIAQARVFYRCQ